jgi:hypothetical protein
MKPPSGIAYGRAEKGQSGAIPPSRGVKDSIADSRRGAGGLYRVKNIASSQALNRSNLLALLSDCEGKAGVDAIHHNRAGAALTVIASFLRAGEVQAFTQQIEQRDSR